MLYQVKGRIQYNCVYTCGKCGMKSIGTTQSMNIDAYGAPQVWDALKAESEPPRPSGMPVGWASYGRGNYKCENCMS